MFHYNLSLLEKEGFSTNRAKLFLNWLNKEIGSPHFPEEYITWAHENGFFAESAAWYNFKQGTQTSSYLSDYDYNLIFPLNDWGRIWVNDKLTLKMALHGTRFSHIMPDYYYYTSKNGLCSLMDNEHGNSLANFINALKQYKTFACKPNNGAMAAGFAKLDYCDVQKCFFINNIPTNELGITDFVTSHPNYLYTEYIVPSSQFINFSPIINTLRINVLNTNTSTPQIISSWIRIPTTAAIISNRVSLASAEDYNFIVKVNSETGELIQAKRMYANKAIDAETYPSSLSYHFTIDNWDTLKKDILGISKYFGTLEWLGFDIGVSDKGFKLMEINTHAGISYTQAFDPLLSHPVAGPYLKDRINQIKSLPLHEKNKRNCIQR